MNVAGWTISIIAIAVALVLAVRWERDSRAAQRQRRRESDLEFMSPAWIAMARREITNALSGVQLDLRPFTLSEEFTNVPRHLSRGRDTIGFFVRVGDGDVEVGDRPDPNADCRVISDYADALELARDPDAVSSDPADAARRVAEGRVTIEGDPARMPAVLRELDIHRLLAAHTA